MTDATKTGEAAAPQTIETARPKQSTVLIETMQRLARESGRPLGRIIRDYVKTSFGPGKLSFDEFVALRLYDPKQYSGADIRGFVGLKATRTIWEQANYRLEFYDLIRNKITMTAFLEAHGFPVIPIAAMFSTTVGYESEKCLHSAEALRGFLTDPANYPLFGKPETGFQSLGSASFARYDEQSRQLVGRNGAATPLDKFIEDLSTHYADGYFFQPQIRPHPENAALCGERLSTLRVLTALRPDGPEILRVCEKLPGGTNVADNFWRPGNLLVTLDPETGRRGRAITGTGFDMRELSHHPDTGKPIAGSTVPNWADVCRLALDGARLFKESALIGWDIAPVAGGAIVVEVNITPDLTLPQLADRRGMLDEAFRAFMEERRRSRRERVRYVKKFNMDAERPSFWT